MRDYQESVTTGQTEAGQSDPYVPLWFADDTKRLETVGMIFGQSMKII